MTYKIKTDKSNEIRAGRTNRYIANKVGCTENYIGKIFLREKSCSKALTMLLIALSKKVDIDNLSEEQIREYFEEVK